MTIYEKVLDVKLETIVVSTDDIKQSGDEKIAKGDFSGFVDHIVKAIWGKLSGGDFNGKHTSEKFGIHQLTLEELEEVVRANIPK